MRAAAGRRRLDGWVSPEAAVLAFGGARELAWFDAGVEGDPHGGSPLPGHPRTSLVGWGDRVVTGTAGVPGSLRVAWEALARADEASGERAQEPPLGWWGWLGYGAGVETLDAEGEAWAAKLTDPEHPDLAFLDVDRALVFDHDAGTVDLVSDSGHEEWASRLSARWHDLARLAAPPEVAGPTPLLGPPRWADTDARYLELIEECRRAIHDGEAYQLCLTTSVEVPLGAPGITQEDLALYLRLRRTSPAPRASFLRFAGVALVGSSPETFLTVDRHGFVESSPIKGTRPRDSDPVADRRAARELRESEKEQAENLMIVDLVRNDLSRVAVPGSVEVTELLAVHSYRHVHQLVSTVRARLAPGASGLDAVRAAFPPGSMTGAPKRSAVELLAGLEAGPRGPYAGVAGRLGRDGTVDLAVVIRTVVLDLSTGLARVGVGGGITASSDPEAEVAEFHLKARALLAVLQSG